LKKIVVVDDDNVVVVGLFNNASSSLLDQENIVCRVNILVMGPTQYLSHWVQDAISQGRKELVHAADHSPQSTADFNNGSYYLSHLLCMRSWCAQDNFIFNITCISRFIGIVC